MVLLFLRSRYRGLKGVRAGRGTGGGTVVFPWSLWRWQRECNCRRLKDVVEVGEFGFAKGRTWCLERVTGG